MLFVSIKIFLHEAIRCRHNMRIRTEIFFHQKHLCIRVILFKGKERLFYICTGGFLACFVINQLFALPGMIGDLVKYIAASNIFGSIATIAAI